MFISDKSASTLNYILSSNSANLMAYYYILKELQKGSSDKILVIQDSSKQREFSLMEHPLKYSQKIYFKLQVNL